MPVLTTMPATTGYILFAAIMVYGLLPRLTGTWHRIQKSDNLLVAVYRITVLISPIFMLMPSIILANAYDVQYGYLLGPVFIFVLFLAQRMDDLAPQNK